MLQCTWYAHYIADSVANGRIPTLSGLWYGDLESVPLAGPSRHKAIKAVVGTLSLPALTPSTLMAL